MCVCVCISMIPPQTGRGVWSGRERTWSTRFDEPVPTSHPHISHSSEEGHGTWLRWKLLSERLPEAIERVSFSPSLSFSSLLSFFLPAFCLHLYVHIHVHCTCTCTHVPLYVCYMYMYMYMYVLMPSTLPFPDSLPLELSLFISLPPPTPPPHTHTYTQPTGN